MKGVPEKLCWAICGSRLADCASDRRRIGARATAGRRVALSEARRKWRDTARADGNVGRPGARTGMAARHRERPSAWWQHRRLFGGDLGCEACGLCARADYGSRVQGAAVVYLNLAIIFASA